MMLRNYDATIQQKKVIPCHLVKALTQYDQVLSLTEPSHYPRSMWYIFFIVIEKYSPSNIKQQTRNLDQTTEAEISRVKS